MLGHDTLLCVWGEGGEVRAGSEEREREREREREGGRVKGGREGRIGGK